MSLAAALVVGSLVGVCVFITGAVFGSWLERRAHLSLLWGRGDDV